MRTFHSIHSFTVYVTPTLTLITNSLNLTTSLKGERESQTTVSNKYNMLSLPVCSISMAAKANNNSTNCDQTILLVSPTTSFFSVSYKERIRPSLQLVSIQIAHWRQDYFLYRHCLSCKTALGFYQYSILSKKNALNRFRQTISPFY